MAGTQKGDIPKPTARPTAKLWLKRKPTDMQGDEQPSRLERLSQSPAPVVQIWGHRVIDARARKA
jgi:hypothetical protein